MEKDNIYNLYFFSLDLLEECREIYNYPFEDLYDSYFKKHGSNLIDFPRLLSFVFNETMVTHPSKYMMAYFSQKLFAQLYVNHRFSGDRQLSMVDRRESTISSISVMTSPGSLTPLYDIPAINISQSPPSATIALITQNMEAEKQQEEPQFSCSPHKIKEMIKANFVRHIMKSYHIKRDGNDKIWTKIIRDDEEDSSADADESIERFRSNTYANLQNYHINSHSTPLSFAPIGNESIPNQQYNDKPKKNPELVHVSIECLSFQPVLFRDTFRGKQMEPLYLYWYLVDIKQKRRLSETFYCDINSKEMKKLIGEEVTEGPLPKKARCAAYEVDSSNSDIMVLFIVTKTLQSNEIMEAYLKPSKQKISEDRFTKGVQSLFPQLQNYQQVMAWACEPLFDFEGNLILPKEIETFYFMDGVRNEHSFYEFFEKRDVKKEKLLPMTLQLHCELQRPYEVPVNKKDSLTDITESTPFGNVSKTSSFLLKGQLATAHMCKMFTFAPNFRSSSSNSNNLYIYPLTLSFKRRSIFLKDTMNIGIIVKLKRNDKDINDEGEKVFMRKNNMVFSEGYSSVSYHSSNPEFNDEIKIKLPEELHSGDHLLFTFVDIECSTEEKNIVPIGYASMMLLGKHGLLITHGKQSISIFKKASTKNYLSGFSEDFKKAGEFKIDFQPVSTRYTTDHNLYEFFSANGLVKVMKNMYGDMAEVQNNINLKLKHLDHVVDIRNLIQYMPQIMDELLLMISLKQYYQVQVRAFELLNSYMDGLKKTERNTKQYIERYIKESFVNHPDSTGLLFEQLLRRYIRSLEEEQRNRANRKSDAFANVSVYNLLSSSSADSYVVKLPDDSLLIENSSIYFQLIEKSLILYMHSQKLLNLHQQNSVSPLRCIKEKKAEVPPAFSQLVDLLSELRQLVVKECKFRYVASMPMAKILVASYGELLTGMLSLLDRGFIITEMEMFLDEFLPSKDQQFEQFQELKNIFLKQVACYDHFLPLCLAYSSSSCLQYTKKNGNYIVYHMCDTHFLSGIFIKRFLLDTLHKQRKVREKAAETFNFLLSRHEYDNRYQSKEVRQKVASLYFPFIILICDLWKTYEELTKADAQGPNEKKPEAQTLLINFLHILINTKKSVFKDWWKHEVLDRKKAFFKILSCVPKLFRYKSSSRLTFSSMDDDEELPTTPRGSSRSLRDPPPSPRNNSIAVVQRKSSTVKETPSRKSFIFPFSKDDTHYDSPRKASLGVLTSPSPRLSHRTSVSILRSQQSSYSQLFRGDSKKKAKEQKSRWKRILSIQASFATLKIMSWIFEEETLGSEEDEKMSTDIPYLKLILDFFFAHLDVEQSDQTYQTIFQLLALFVKNYKVHGFFYTREELIKKINEFGTKSPTESTKMLALAFTKWMRHIQQNDPVPISSSSNRQSTTSSYLLPKLLDRTKSSLTTRFDGTLNISDLLWNIKVRYKERQYVEQLKSWLNSQQPDVITAVEFLEKEFVRYMYPDDFSQAGSTEQAEEKQTNEEDEELLSVMSDDGEEISIFQALRQL